MKEVTAITTCPPILFIVICRRKQDGGSSKSSVQFPVSGVNITEDDLQYNLVGTIHHKPRGPDHGHYTSICQSQRSQSRNWFNYNDDKVSISKFINIKQKDRVLRAHTKMANFLFYVSGSLQTRIGSRGPKLIYKMTQHHAHHQEIMKTAQGKGEGKTMLHQPHHLKVC